MQLAPVSRLNRYKSRKMAKKSNPSPAEQETDTTKCEITELLQCKRFNICFEERQVSEQVSYLLVFRVCHLQNR